jgi:hypothetical protein
MAEKLYSSIIDCFLSEPSDFDAVDLKDARASGQELSNLTHDEVDRAFTRSIEGDRGEVHGGVHFASGGYDQNCPACSKPLQKDQLGVLRCYNNDCSEEGLTAQVSQPIDDRDPLGDPFDTVRVSSVPNDWKNRAAAVTSDDNALADVSISLEKAKGTTVETKGKRISDESIRAAIRKAIAAGHSKEKIANYLKKKLAENVIFNWNSAHEYLDAGGTEDVNGMDYWEPNKFMEKKQFTAAEHLAKIRDGAEQKTADKAPIVRVDDKVTQRTTAAKTASTIKTTSPEFTVAAISKAHTAGASLEKIYSFGVKTAGVVRAADVVKKFVGGLKTAGTKIALSQIDCRFLKGKLGVQNAIVGAPKCSSCAYRSSMHCGLTGGTLLSFPGMSTASSNHKIASGAPKDGHQMLNEYDLSSTAKLGDIDIIQPKGYEIEVGSHFSLEI